jgi:hypothetical protein
MQQGASRDRDEQRSPQAPETPASAHPGFDRLRALAQREGQQGKRQKPQGGSAGRGQRPGRGGGQPGGSSQGRRRRR